MSIRMARYLGYLVQSLILGGLIALAVVQLIAMAGGGGNLFRYQGF